MRFMLIFYMPEGTWISKEIVRKIVGWKQRLGAVGVYETGSPLKPIGMTHTLHLNQETGEVEVEDSAYDDRTKVFYAFEILRCADEVEAITHAKSHPALGFDDTHLEVREIWDSIDPDMMGEEYVAPVLDPGMTH